MTAIEEQLAPLDQFTGIDLDELQLVASLQSRVDRKYLVPADRSTELLRSLSGEVAVLRIDDSTAFRYDTIYFDTPDLDSYLGTAHGRRNRFKVRIRTYADSGLCMLEVKRKSGRGETVKLRLPHPLEARSTLTPAAASFVDESLGRTGLAARLQPVLSTTFVRSTLLDRSDGSRATIDRDIRLCVPGGEAVLLRRQAIVETKSIGAATEVDRWLWRSGCRPSSFSKFCVGMALHRTDLPANKWNRILRRDLGWTPHREPARPG